MNTAIVDIMRESEGRYLLPDEMQTLQSYIDDLPRRIRVYQTLQAKENELLDRVMEKFQPTLPNLTRQHGPTAWQRCRRDLAMAWRYCALAMVLNDEDYLRDKLLYWLETILKSFKMRDQCNPAYRMMLDSLQLVFTSEECELIRPYVMLTQMMLKG